MLATSGTVSIAAMSASAPAAPSAAVSEYNHRNPNRALRAGIPARWLAGDGVCGNDPGLRAECEAHRTGYAPAIGCDRRVPNPAGPIRPTPSVGLRRIGW